MCMWACDGSMCAFALSGSRRLSTFCVTNAPGFCTGDSDEPVLQQHGASSQQLSNTKTTCIHYDQVEQSYVIDI